jgi:MraZ protein
MTPFSGTHQNRRDAKGRVSVPAPFRNVLKAADGTAGLVLRPSHRHACIEGWPAAVFEGMAARLETMDVLSAAYDDLSTNLYSEAWPTEPDKEGRVMLPDSLVNHAGLGETVEFVGVGRIFQIWDPAAAAARRKAARERVLARDMMQEAGG